MKSQVKAKAIDNTKDKILYAGAALLLGLAAAALFSNTASAQTAAIVQDEQVQNQTQKTNKIEGEWTPHVQVQDQVTIPFQLKSQKLSH